MTGRWQQGLSGKAGRSTHNLHGKGGIGHFQHRACDGQDDSVTLARARTCPATPSMVKYSTTHTSASPRINVAGQPQAWPV